MFPLDADTAHPPDFALMRDGGLTLFRRPAVLEETEAALAGIGYELVALDATHWDGERLHRDFASALDFPAYYGGNLAALADCLYDVAHGDYGWKPARTGLVVSIRGFGHLARRDQDLAVHIADCDSNGHPVRAPPAVAASGR